MTRADTSRKPAFSALVIAFFVVVACSDYEPGTTVTVAVASNFSDTANELAKDFTEITGHDVTIIPGSSGKLYAQIKNGAPIDIFLSADIERPKLLQSEVSGTVFVYALGRLVIWSASPAIKDNDCYAALENTTGKIAIANPRLAPYGEAAQQFLQRSGLWTKVQSQLIYGENISQTLQFAASGNASVALIARAQLRLPQLQEPVCVSDVPGDGHNAIEQAGIVTEFGSRNPAAGKLAAYLVDVRARALIRSHGYQLPETGTAIAGAGT